MDVYDLTVPQLTRMLRNLDRWLALAAAHDKAPSLLGARLAADQFTLTRQIQTATDNAKMMVGRLANKPWPSHPDTETTFDELRARIASVIDYLQSFAREDFIDVAERTIKLPWMKDDQHMHAVDYLVEFALPNFYFHMVTAYSILRHEGVAMGKMDYIGQISIR
jgi:uncharacterized protein